MTADCLARILYRIAQHAVCLLGAELGIKRKGGECIETREGEAKTPGQREEGRGKYKAIPLDP